jgi:hypothetical protein
MKTQSENVPKHRVGLRLSFIPKVVFWASLVGCFAADSRTLAADVYGIDILSSQYSLSGSWTAYDMNGQQYASGKYSRYSNDGQPISFYQGGPCTVLAGINTFWMRNRSYVGFDHLQTLASASWVFQPQNPLLTVSLNGFLTYNYYPWEQNLNFWLRDLTSGLQLIDMDYHDNGTIGLQYQFDVDTTHVYSFAIDFAANYFSFKDVNMTVSASFFARSVVPDLLSTGWLILAPLAGLALLRRRSC